MIAGPNFRFEIVKICSCQKTDGSGAVDGTKHYGADSRVHDTFQLRTRRSGARISPGAPPKIQTIQILLRRYGHPLPIRLLPGMPTVCLLRPIHCRTNGLLLRVNVTLRDVHVPVPSEARQGPRIHKRCPALHAGVTEGVELTVKAERLPSGSIPGESASPHPSPFGAASSGTTAQYARSRF